MAPGRVQTDEGAAREAPWLAALLSAQDLSARRKDGILRFVDSDSYAESFGKEWNWFSTTQLDRVEEGRTESRETFFEKTGFSPEELEGKTILDVGCGMGRFAQVAADHGARVVGVDLSVAVEAAHANLGALPDTAFVQADVFQLPFKPESFDLIYSIGVLHHTPDTRAAFSQLPRLLKADGKIAIWVYTDEYRRLYLVSDLLRKVTSRMDAKRLLSLCKIAVPLGRLYRTRFGRYLMPLLPVSQHPDPEWRVLDTFDWYAPKYQWKHGWEEVEGWFRDAGLLDIERQGVAVSVSGRRPA
jgi:ubiquinone/menaquinone biosynthesis C-methylase UbiE